MSLVFSLQWSPADRVYFVKPEATIPCFWSIRNRTGRLRLPVFLSQTVEPRVMFCVPSRVAL